MAVVLKGGALPQGATVAIHVEMTASVNVTPYGAQQQVTQFAITNISSQLRGGSPDLHVGDRMCWSVPVLLTSPARGIVGRVGEILVDVATGEVLADGDTVQRIADDAERLAQRSPLIKQEHNFSCVAACVRMVLAYCGQPRTEAELR